MQKSVRVTVSLPRDLAEFAADLASQRRVARSQVIAGLLEEKRRSLQRRTLAEGYRVFAADNQHFAREALPLAAEVWDDSWAVAEEQR